MIRLFFVLFIASGLVHAKKQEESHCQCEIDNSELHGQILEAMKQYKAEIRDDDYVLAIASKNGHICFFQDHSADRYLDFDIGDLITLERFWSFQCPLSREMIFDFPQFIFWLSTVSGQSSNNSTKRLFNVVKCSASSFPMKAFKWVALLVPASKDIEIDIHTHPLSALILEKLRKPGWFQWARSIKPTVEWCTEGDGEFKVYYTFPVGVSIDTKSKGLPSTKSAEKVLYNATNDEFAVK